ncbi:MAG: nucleotide-binding protein [Saprospiraceae bacterium]|nr:nucleotide-binding protein [Saprospiraceae bacterium]MCF8248748.1 nucleotide-binding protein [Saprospiraceae bacterium]MCF8278762.1 nucleotide-binding protein [Bacteroidales bacterium]MCF8310562.1 nucleotide-binding protein [Saprospiraceae bacterium]MCF8439121.1 nucleotide-binding protein [Saprospiraceae bacterium]
MIKRFQGEEGKRKIIQALTDCQIFIGDTLASEKIAEVGNLFPFIEGQIIITQGESDDDLYIILSGELEIHVNKRLVAVRDAAQDVGEMCVVDPKAPRSATVKARTNGVALKVSESDFTKIADQHPILWRNIASQLANRLRERGRLLKAPNEIIKIFIGCAVESLAYAQQLQALLDHDPVEVRIWTDNVFSPSSYTLQDLMEQVNCVDFAIFFAMPEDLIESKDEESYGPRDNVILEIGLFMGKLGKERVYLIKKRKAELKIPTDLLGFQTIDFDASKTDLSIALNPVCLEIRKMLKKLGPV